MEEPDAGFYSSSTINTANYIDEQIWGYSETSGREFYFAYKPTPWENEKLEIISQNGKVFDTNGNADQVSFEKVSKSGDYEVYKITLGDKFEAAWVDRAYLNVKLKITGDSWSDECEYGIELPLNPTGLVAIWPDWEEYEGYSGYNYSHTPKNSAGWKSFGMDQTQILYFGVRDEMGNITPIEDMNDVVISARANIQKYQGNGAVSGFYEVKLLDYGKEYTFTYQGSSLRIYNTTPSPSGGGGSTGGGSTSGGNTTGGTTGDSGTSTETKPDGSKVETSTETKPDGSKVETTTETKPDGSKVETTTETKTDGSKVETSTETKPDGSKVETSTETKTDGSKVETSTETKTDGSKVETTTETKTDGSKVETSTETKADGSKVEANSETKTDGSKKETIVETSKDGDVKTTETVTKADGSATKTEKEKETNSKGKEVAVTTTTKTDTEGKVTSVTEKSVIGQSSPSTNTTVTVKKDSEGDITSASASIAKTVSSGNKATVSSSIVAQIIEAAGTKSVDVTMTVKDSDGKTKYKVKVDAEELTPGKELYVYKLDTKTGKYTMVNAKTYEVSKSGSVALSMNQKATYELVTAKEAAKIDKQIKSTIVPKKDSASVKKGKSAEFTLSSKADENNIKSITYTTSKKSVATVNKDGKITAKGKGAVTVTAKVTLKNGAVKTIKMKIKVK